MSPNQHMHVELSLRDLSEIEKHTYYVSNFMCSLLHFIELLPPDLPPPVSERATMVVGLVERSNTQLHKLMSKIGQIRNAAVRKEVTGEKDEETLSISQSPLLQKSAGTYR